MWFSFYTDIQHHCWHEHDVTNKCSVMVDRFYPLFLEKCTQKGWPMIFINQVITKMSCVGPYAYECPVLQCMIMKSVFAAFSPTSNVWFLCAKHAAYEMKNTNTHTQPRHVVIETNKLMLVTWVLICDPLTFTMWWTSWASLCYLHNKMIYKYNLLTKWVLKLQFCQSSQSCKVIIYYIAIY